MTDSVAPRGVWIHVFEEDSAAGAVFRPEDADVPLSRRARERVELRSSGMATFWTAGPDDRLSPVQARWAAEGGELVVRDTAGGVRLRVVDWSTARLLVKRA